MAGVYVGKQAPRVVGRAYFHAYARFMSPQNLLHQATQDIHKHVSINGRRPTHREARSLADRWVGGVQSELISKEMLKCI